MAVLLQAGPARAQEASADSLAPLPGTVRGDTLAMRLPRAPAGWSEQPRFVMLRSLVVPGWGQFHNRSWLKAAGVAAVEGWLLAALVEDGRRLSDLQDEVDAAPDSEVVRRNDAVNRYNAALDTFVGRQWLLGGVLAYALVDAYVDAHFRSFDLEFRHDPALPETPPPGANSRAAGGTSRRGGARLALRWHF